MEIRTELSRTWSVSINPALIDLVTELDGGTCFELNTGTRVICWFAVDVVRMTPGFCDEDSAIGDSSSSLIILLHSVVVQHVLTARFLFSSLQFSAHPHTSDLTLPSCFLTRWKQLPALVVQVEFFFRFDEFVLYLWHKRMLTISQRESRIISNMYLACKTADGR